MKIIKLNATNWKTPGDFYDALLPRLGAPEWHDGNLNALIGSMIWEEINSVVPPYTIEIDATGGLPPAVIQELNWAEEDVKKARSDFKALNGHDIQVNFEIKY